LPQRKYAAKKKKLIGAIDTCHLSSPARTSIASALTRRRQVKDVRIGLLNSNVYPLHVSAPASLSNRHCDSNTASEGHQDYFALTFVFVALVVDVFAFRVKVPHGAFNTRKLVHTAL